ncbi:hypothetical protein [Actinokineospora sp.]|uniref:hypothetical protein n=1 Tax=Actinokineospora sp. TaxID=1872133 RepID=UPI004037A0A5
MVGFFELMAYAWFVVPLLVWAVLVERRPVRRHRRANRRLLRRARSHDRRVAMAASPQPAAARPRTPVGTADPRAVASTGHQGRAR